MSKYLEYSGIIKDDEELFDNEHEFDFKYDIDDNLNEYDRKIIRDINFKEFFKNNNEFCIYIFIFEKELYTIIQKSHHIFEQKAILKWFEVDNYGNMIEHKENMISIVDSEHILSRISEIYLNSFKIYRIPFYMIPLIKETYSPSKFGEMKGNWEIKIHENVKLHNNPLPFKLEFPKFILRDYQLSAITEWHNNGDFGVISMATAGGKTIVGIQILYDMKVSTLIAVPTTPLIFQWQEEISKYLNIGKEKIGVFYSSKKELKAITIGTYNSLMKYINFSQDDIDIINKMDLSEIEKSKRIRQREKIRDYLQNYYSLLILDECHHIPAPTFRYLALNSNALIRIGLSATIERFDKNESLIFFCCGKKVFELNYIDLCEEGWVVPFIYKYIGIPLTESEMEIYKKIKTIDKKKAYCFYNNSKLHYICKIVKKHIELNHQILIFTSYIKSAYEIYDELNSLGIITDLILSKNNQRKKSVNKRDDVIKSFKNKKIQVIISTTVLDEGFNIPDCCVGIIVSGSSSQRQMIQRVGRIVRKSENNPNKIGYIYEITTEGDDKMPTLDEYNHLMRNGMILSTEKYKKDREILDSSFWILDYEIIKDYAYKKIKNQGIDTIEEIT